MIFKAVDLTKFFLAICIFLMHAGFYELIPGGALIKVLTARLGVPYFFVASGFFFGRAVYSGKLSPDSLRSLWDGYLRRLVQKLLVFEPANIILESVFLLALHDSFGRVVLKMARSIIFCPSGALWYIQALIIAVLLLVPLMRKNKEYAAIPFALAGYFFLLICDRYYFLIEGTPFASVVRKIIYITGNMRNGFTVGLLFTLIGILMAKKDLPLGKGKIRWFILPGFITLILEFFLLEGHVYIDEGGSYLAFIWLIPVLFAGTLALELPERFQSKPFRNMSTMIYLINCPIIRIVNIAELLIHGELYEDPSARMWIFLLEAVLIGLAVAFIYRRKNSRIFPLFI